MAHRPEMFESTRGFSGMADSMEPCKMLWADRCCHGNEIWARRGDPVVYRLVYLLTDYNHCTYDIWHLFTADADVVHWRWMRQLAVRLYLVITLSALVVLCAFVSRTNGKILSSILFTDVYRY